MAAEEEAVASEEGLADGRSAYMSILSLIPGALFNGLAETTEHEPEGGPVCTLAEPRSRTRCPKDRERWCRTFPSTLAPNNRREDIRKQGVVARPAFSGCTGP